MNSAQPEITAMKWLTAFMASAWLSVPSCIKLLMLILAMEVVSALFNRKAQLLKVVKEAVASLLLTLMAEAVYLHLNSMTASKLNFGFDPVAMVAFFYVLRSGVDVLLNFSEVIPIPSGLVSLLLKAKGLTAKEKAALESIKTED